MSRNIIMIGLEEENAEEVFWRLRKRYNKYEIMRIYFKNIAINYEEALIVNLQFYNAIMLEAKAEKKSLIIDMQGIEMEDAIRYFGKECDIYCFSEAANKDIDINYCCIDSITRYGKCNVVNIKYLGKTHYEIREIVDAMEIHTVVREEF